MNKFLKLSSILLLFVLVFSCKPSGEKAETKEAGDVAVAEGMKYTVDAATSKVLWIGSKVAGKHNGDISLKNGEIAMKNGKITGGNFTIDMTTINVMDLEGGQKEALQAHLMGTGEEEKSDHFFNVGKFPTATFEITKATQLMNDENSNYIIAGNLTIKGVTKEITFKANAMKEGDMMSVKTPEFKIDRTEWGIKYGSASFFDGLKEKAINNEMTLQVNLVAKK